MKGFIDQTPGGFFSRLLCRKGSMLINLIMIMLVTAVIGATLISLTSTTTVQQVFSDSSQKAELLAVSGFRYLASQYKLAGTETARNATLKSLNGQTFVLSGNDGRFSLSIAPYFYIGRTLVTAGSTQLPAEFPGTKPAAMTIPGTGTLGILSGSTYTQYTYTSVTGNSLSFSFNGIAKTSDLSPGLKMDLAAGSTVYPVFGSETKNLTNGNGNSLTVTGAGTLMAPENGVFEVINTSGAHKDGNGNTTSLYIYKTRTGDTLYDISIYKSSGTAFSMTLNSTTRIVVHRSAEIGITGTINYGTETETNRSFTNTAALGDSIVTVSASDMLYNNPENVLVNLIDNAGMIGNSTGVSNGKITNAMAFDGNMSYVRLNDTAALDLGSAGSIGAWIKITAFDNNFAGIIRKGGKADDSDLAYSLEFRPNHSIRLRIVSTTSALTLDSNINLTTGIWYHVAGTWGASGMRLYINGQLDNSRPETLVARNTTGTVQIGAQLDEMANPSQKNYGFHGVLDEVFIMTTQKSLCEIRDIFSNPCNTGCDAYTYYPLNGTFTDQSGEDKTGNSAHTGIPSGTSFDTDRFGCSQRACRFLLWDNVTIPQESDFDMTGAFTLSFWVKVGSWSFILGNDPFVSKGTDSYQVQRYVYSNNADFRSVGLTPSDTHGNDNLGNGAWHHVAAVYTGSQKYLYVDGVLDANDNVTGSIHTNDSNLMLGSIDLFSVFTGWIDDVAIWKRALSQSEITNIYSGLRTNPALP